MSSPVESESAFSMSFVDLMASALGAVLLLVLLLAVSEKQEADRAADQALLGEVQIRESRGGDPVPCRVYWFVWPPGDMIDRPVPVEGTEGGLAAQRLVEFGLARDLRVVAPPGTGWSKLWIGRAAPGEWSLLLRAGDSSNSKPIEANIRLTFQVGNRAPKVFTGTVMIVPGREVPIALPDDGFTVLVPESATE